MPYVRISMTQGRSAETVRRIADGVHRALVASFNVPPDDRFQAIHQHAPGELIFDPGYFGVSRTSDYMLIAITVGKPRSKEVKQATYRRIVEELKVSAGVRPEDVMIVISTSQPEDWSFGAGEAQMLTIGLTPAEASHA
jgi:phenylpyruvate tautomerase PptA (4-oxalocrotonate tautomerase family)